MSWLANFVRPKLRSLVHKVSDVPDNLWIRCANCEQMLFHRELKENTFVCHHCGHHMRMNPHDRLKSLFDDGDYTRIEYDSPVNDPLKFKDVKKYSDRLKAARKKTNEEDAIFVALGKIQNQSAVIAAFNFDFMGGSMGAAVGNGILAAAKTAIQNHVPLIVIPSSGGARMQEGIISLMQMARTTIGITQVKEAGLPYIVLLSDPTTGGVSASFAMLGDVAIAEPGATIGFAGSRVIQETIRAQLPTNFQKSEYLLEHGMIDLIVHRHQLKAQLGQIIDLLMVKKA